MNPELKLRRIVENERQMPCALALNKADVAIIETGADLAAAASALLKDVRERHPGEDIRCPHLRAMDAALSKIMEIA